MNIILITTQKSLNEIMLKSTYLLLRLPTYHLTAYLPTYFKPTNNFLLFLHLLSINNDFK